MSAAALTLPLSMRSLERVAEVDAHEGPVYVADEDALYFTTVRRGTQVSIKRLELGSRRISVLREDANVANGMALDAGGFLVVCEQGTFERPARISRVDRRTGQAEPLVDMSRGLSLNSPNDVVVARDGSIWFTDPSYGFLQGFRPEPQAGDHVYRLDPATGALAVAANGFDKPNGLAFSPDERTLYVSDNGAPHQLLAFDLDAGVLTDRRVVAVGDREHPDGLKVDAEGRIYVSARTGVHVYSPAGERVGAIELPGAVNFCFGRPERDVLYITTDTAVWAAVLNTKGA